MTELDDRPVRRPRIRRRTLLIGVALVVAVGLVIGLALFQPWKIFTRSTVDEAAPVASVAGTTPAVTTPAVTTTATAGPSGAPAGNASAATTAATTAAAQSGAPAGTAAATSAAGPVGGSAAATAPATGGPAAPAPNAPAAPAPAPAPTEPVMLASGNFVDGEHATSGTVRVLQLADGSRFVRLEGFSAGDGPDVHVWVTDQEAGGSDWGKYDDGRYLELGSLKGTDGNQNYPVPAEADLAGLTSVVIWCDRFNVAFGSAAVDL